MKTLNNKDKNFDKILDNLLQKRKLNIQSNLVLPFTKALLPLIEI